MIRPHTTPGIPVDLTAAGVREGGGMPCEPDLGFSISMEQVSQFSVLGEQRARA